MEDRQAKLLGTLIGLILGCAVLALAQNWPRGAETRPVRHLPLQKPLYYKAPAKAPEWTNPRPLPMA